MSWMIKTKDKIFLMNKITTRVNRINLWCQRPILISHTKVKERPVNNPINNYFNYSKHSNNRTSTTLIKKMNKNINLKVKRKIDKRVKRNQNISLIHLLKISNNKWKSFGLKTLQKHWRLWQKENKESKVW